MTNATPSNPERKPVFARVAANLFCGDQLPPLRDGGFACWLGFWF